MTPPKENLAAYQEYLLGRQQLAKLTSGSLGNASGHFQRAIDLDPGFALAYVALAQGCIDQVHVSGLSTEELLAKAQAATDRALRPCNTQQTGNANLQ